jgi:hypothetical protein
MAFGREMHYEIEVVAAKQGLDQLGVADVAMDELEALMTLHGIEIGTVSRISERIEHDD